MKTPLINNSQVRAYALDTLKRTRPHLPHDRVSAQFYQLIESRTRKAIEEAIAFQPSRGKTIVNPYHA